MSLQKSNKAKEKYRMKSSSSHTKIKLSLKESHNCIAIPSWKYRPWINLFTSQKKKKKDLYLKYDEHLIKFEKFSI